MTDKFYIISRDEAQALADKEMQRQLETEGSPSTAILVQEIATRYYTAGWGSGHSEGSRSARIFTAGGYEFSGFGERLTSFLRDNPDSPSEVIALGDGPDGSR
jgi:hypothetical protein